MLVTTASHNHWSAALRSEALVGFLREATCHSRQALGHVSDQAVAWQPFAHGHSISAMLLHVADQESLVVEEVILGGVRSEIMLELFGSDLSTVERGAWPKPMSESLEWHYSIQDAVRGRTEDVLTEEDPTRLVHHPKWGEITIATAVLHLVQHEAYHAGQMALHKLHYGWGGVEPEMAA